MHNILNSLTIDDKDSCVVKHFGQTHYVILLDFLAGICQLKLTLWVRSLTDFTKDYIRKSSFRAYNNFRTQISHTFNNVAINEKRPKFRNIHQIILWIFKTCRAIFRVKNRFRVNKGNQSVLLDWLSYFVQLNSQTERNTDWFFIRRQYRKFLQIQVLANYFQKRHILFTILIDSPGRTVHKSL